MPILTLAQLIVNISRMGMGAAMMVGTIVANRFIKNMDKNKFQKYVAVLLCVVGGYMLIFGA